MNYDYPQTRLSKTLLTGVFAGIIATLVNLVYDYFYRDFVKFYPSEFINVSSIIFATMLLFLIAGIIYFLLSKFIKYGDIVYIVLFCALTVICFIASMHVNRSSNPSISEEFRGLLLGTVAVTGLLAAFLIPYLTKHDTLYNE